MTVPHSATPTVDTIGETVRGATRALAGHGDSPRLDAELLLSHVLRLSRSALIVRGDEPVPAASLHAYDALISQRQRGIPVAYLTGTREFWSLALTVTADVLVPRPETELLVEQALARLPQHEARSVLDLGTGSGAIALAIAAERPLARVTAVDVSERALDVAIGNAARLGARIDWRAGSWFEPVAGERFDMIIANPPYIAAGDPALLHLAAEPALALAAGPTGLEALAAIIGAAASHLQPGGWLLLEHGSTQAADVARLLQRQDFAGIRSYADHSDRPRVTLGTLHASSHQENS